VGVGRAPAQAAAHRLLALRSRAIRLFTARRGRSLLRSISGGADDAQAIQEREATHLLTGTPGGQHFAVSGGYLYVRLPAVRGGDRQRRRHGHVAGGAAVAYGRRLCVRNTGRHGMYIYRERKIESCTPHSSSYGGPALSFLPMADVVVLKTLNDLV